MRTDSAFTIVELLVVVTIIVVLLALLVPSLQEAIYQAELTVCGAGRQKVVASGVTGYAFDNKRHYPHREIIDRGYTPVEIQRDVDDRPRMMRAFPLNALNCPLTPGAIDMSPEANLSDTWILSPYVLWFDILYGQGSNFNRGGVYSSINPPVRPGEKRMSRLGSRFSWADVEYEWIIGDYDWVVPAGNYTMGTHPDREGQMIPRVWQNHLDPVWAGIGAAFGFSTITLSRWELEENTTWRRNLLDLNFASADGAVIRFNRVKPMGDERMNGVPAIASAEWVVDGHSRINIPKP